MSFKLIKQVNKPPAQLPIQCVLRNYSARSDELRCVVGQKQKTGACAAIPSVNSDETKYKNYNYNGLFHKGLQHNGSDGRLIFNSDYETMRNAILNDDQVALNAVPLCLGAKMKLVNPLASLCTPLVGAPQCLLSIELAPSLSSDAGAAEMVEVYAMAVARDVPFTDYGTDGTIAGLLQNTQLNKPDLLASIKYSPTPNVAFTTNTIFMGNTYGETIGPFISQLLLLNVPMGAGNFTQKYTTPKSRATSVSRVEWGIDNIETSNMQNTKLDLLPAATSSSDTTSSYIFSGRSLAEAVHNDPSYQFFYQAALILLALGVSNNPNMPVYTNQIGFSTGTGGPSLIGAIADVSTLALQHAWWWKWRKCRKLRPEAFGLAIHNVLNNIVINTNNYDMSDVILQNDIVNSVATINNTYYSAVNSYCLPMAFREGSPLHPAYPSGHATIAGACCTIMKIFLDADVPWSTLPGLQSGSINRRVLPSPLTGPAVMADSTGANLVNYAGGDISSMTVCSEINKLASNVAGGRNWSGVHYRSDAYGGILLGEQVAMRYMEDILSSWAENNIDGTSPSITFRKFDGTFATIKPSLCK